MKYYEIITESVGLANRKEGQVFTNPEGEKITFKELVFYPAEGKFDSIEERDASIDETTNKLKEEGDVDEIEWVNASSGKSLAYGIATFTTEEGDTRAFGRYFQQISKIRSQNNWPNNDIPGNFKFASSSSAKARSGLMPQDILTDMENLSPENIRDAIANKFGEDDALTKAVDNLIGGSGLPIIIENKDKKYELTAVRDYFCELLQPIALIKGAYTGNAGDAAEKFFGMSGFEGSSISFSSGKNEGLYDSILNGPEDKRIKVSTKGGMGATASVKNIYNSIVDLVQLIGTEPFEPYIHDLEVIRLISENGQVDGPLKLAVYYDLLTEEETDEVKLLAKTQDPTGLSGRLKKMYNAVADTDKSIPFFKMLWIVATFVAGYVNKNTNFGAAVAFVLNNDALIQVYSDAKEKDGNIVIENFKTVFPAELSTSVELSAQKTYFSSGCKGKYSFKIKKD